MEVGVRLEGGGIELATAFGEDGAEVVQQGDMPIGDRLIHQRPEMLGGLEFGRCAVRLGGGMAATDLL